MAFNINSFRTNLRDFGYLDNNSFSVMVQTPPGLFNKFLGNQGTPTAMYKIARNMEFRIDQVRVPGISLLTADVNRYGIGPIQKQPISAQYSEINFSILCDHYCEIWQYWYNWARLIFEFNGTSGGSSPSYTAEYKQNYATTIVVFIYDHYGNIIQKVNFFETFPTAVREVPLGWADPNLIKMNISMMYTEYTIEGSSLEPKTENQNPNLRTGAQTTTISAG
jgi:hypothetical protein